MSNSVVTLSSFNILFFTQVLTVLTSTIKYNEYVTDKGENISIPCIADGNIMWVKENGSNNSTIIQTGKYLVLTNVSASDRGLYVCFAAVSSSSHSLDYGDDNRQSERNATALNDENVANEKQNNDEREDEQVLLTSTTKTNHISSNETFLKPLVENKINNYQIINATATTNKKSQNASTTSTLSMPNITTTTAASASVKPTQKSTLQVSASASAIATTASTTNITTTTTVIKTLSNGNISTQHSTTTKHISKTASISNTTTSSSSNNTTSSSSSRSSSSSDVSLTNFTLNATPTTSTTTIDVLDDIEEQEFQAFQKINLTVRTPPGPVAQLYFKASTILGFLVWRFNKTNSGGYPVRSFTAEFRNVSYATPPFNSSFEHKWSRMDPINIAPNVRQMEVYRLEPNTTYEFRIWANNQLGSGEVVTTNVTTLPETKEEDLIRLIQPDLDNFDPRIWIIAVSIVLGTFVILAIGLCIVLTKECYQSSQAEFEDGWDSIELIPNIILNPGFCETDGQTTAPRTVIFGGDDDSDESCESESDHEPRMQKFKRKLSVFFTDPTIYRSHI